MSPTTADNGTILRVGFDDDHAIAIEVIDTRRTNRRSHARHLTERNALVVVASDEERQRLEIGDNRARLRSETDRDVPCLP